MKRETDTERTRRPAVTAAKHPDGAGPAPEPSPRQLAPERAARLVTRASDAILDFGVLALGAWTAVYHVCLVLHLDTTWAALAGGLALIPCAWFAVRDDIGVRSATEPPRERPSWRLPLFIWPAQLALAIGAAGLFAFGAIPWHFAWPLWMLAAGGAVLVTYTRPRPQPAPSAGEESTSLTTWPSTLVALGWALGFAVVSLFLIRSDGDDAYYVHQSAWVAAHGEFPLRDTMFTDQSLPAIIYPPVSSFESLIGTVAQFTGLAAANITYFVVPFLGSALAVLAAWRLIRTWRTPAIGIALSTTMVFLLMDAASGRTFGNFFAGRIWQGKVVFLSVLVPIIWALLTRYAEQPTRRDLVLLAGAGAAGAGLTSTGVFVVPVIAAGALVALAARAPRQALSGLAAAVAYPLATGIVVLAVGGRNAQTYNGNARAGELIHDVLGHGVLAFLGVLALLIGPTLVRSTLAARMTATAVLVVGCLYAPSAPRLIFHLTGLGEVLWRLTWALPAAVLIGVGATSLGARLRSPYLRPMAAGLVVVAVAVSGTAIWSAPGGQTITTHPTLKRFPRDVTAARRILARTEAGDVVLAPTTISTTILTLSGRVTTVAPRPFYARALVGVPGGHVHERLILYSFAEAGLGPVVKPVRRDIDQVRAPEVIRALRAVGVDLACVGDRAEGARAVLRDAGYTPVLARRSVSCFRRTTPAP